MIKRIITRMAELRHVARLARIIDKENDRLNLDTPAGMPEDFAYSHATMVKVVDALGLFKKRRFRKDLSPRKIEKIYRNAKSEGYIEEKIFTIHTNTINGFPEARNCLKVTDDKGRNLVRKRLFIFAVGYWKAILYDNRQVLGLLTIIDGVIVAIGTVINLYLAY